MHGNLKHTLCLNPTQLPATLSGTLITNQMRTSASIVVKGTAPLDPLAQTNMLSKKNTANTNPGINTGVKTMFRLQASPPKDLYTRADTYPPMKPKKV